MSSKNTHAAPALASQNSKASSTITFIHHGSFFFFVQISSNTLLAIKRTRRENSLSIAVKKNFFFFKKKMQNIQQSSLPNASQPKKLENSFWNFSSNLEKFSKWWSPIANYQELCTPRHTPLVFDLWCLILSLQCLSCYKSTGVPAK